MSAEMNGSSTNDLERENAKLRSELSAARAREFHQRDAIRSLLTNGQLLDIDDVRAKIAAGGPNLQHWIEFEREIAEAEEEFREIMANPVPLRPVLEDAERLLEAGKNAR